MYELNSKFSLQKGRTVTGAVGLNAQPYLLEKICSQVVDRDVIFVTKNRIEGQKVLNTLKFLIGGEVLFFPEWDTVPYEKISPAQTLLHQRMQTLFQLLHSPTSKVIVTSVRAALQRIPTKMDLKSRLLNLKVGQIITRTDLLKSLAELGYTRVSFVTTPGDFSIRGGIVDISSNETGYGYRIDFFGDKIDNIKQFDISSQITSIKKKSAHIFPPSELVISADTIANFENYLLNTMGANYKKNQLLSALHEQIKPAGIENFLSAFYSKVGSISEYLKDPVIVLDNFAQIEATKFLDKAEKIYEESSKDAENVILPVSKVWLSMEEFNKKLGNSCVIEFSPFKEGVPCEFESIPAFYQKDSPFERLKEFILQQIKSSRAVILSCLSEGSRERIIKLLSDYDIVTVKSEGWPKTHEAHQVSAIVSPIEHGAICKEYAVVTEEDLFGEKIKSLAPKKKLSLGKISTEQCLQIGEIVVHKEYGVGRFEGLELIKLSNSQHDCLKILYSKNNKLFVPVENMDVLVKYGSASENIALDSLERTSWQFKKAKAKNKIRKIARYLLEIAAQRNLEYTDKITLNTKAYEEFCASFPYVETEDQESAISAILEDLIGGKPMDRLICGDTGFGKTEVAIRTAFVVMNSKKPSFEVHRVLVVLICPTTLLCRQHYQVFKERLKKSNIQIAQLSRLVSTMERAQTIQRINAGKIDIVIGTHALLTDKIDYKNLSLLIVDEEQHFGVSHKERLKKLKKSIHVLTLSATPIPRTLQMSLAGIRELNLITTPPVNRIATKISVAPFDPVMVKEALIRERNRGGQSFYICPRISDLSSMEDTLRTIVPNLKVVKAHGKVPVAELDRIMEDFYEGKFDILLSTSIIESGLDIPKANTMIVHNSDKFGLAQLYQLKGRVGRSNVASYAFFTVKENKVLNPISLKKLQVLQNLDELGAGFSLASYDMDIRGFGNLLGEEQSGHIKEIGVELYQQMLEETLDELKKTDAQTPAVESWVPQINIDVSVLIPESYISDFDLRLSLYKKASCLITENELTAFAAELIDRFGPIPSELEALLSIVRLKQLCLKSFVRKINLGDKGILIEFVETKDPGLSEKLLELVMKNKEQVKLKSSNSILLVAQIKAPEKRLQFAKRFLENIRT